MIKKKILHHIDRLAVKGDVKNNKTAFKRVCIYIKLNIAFKIGGEIIKNYHK